MSCDFDESGDESCGWQLTEDATNFTVGRPSFNADSTVIEPDNVLFAIGGLGGVARAYSPSTFGLAGSEKRLQVEDHLPSLPIQRHKFKNSSTLLLNGTCSLITHLTVVQRGACPSIWSLEAKSTPFLFGRLTALDPRDRGRWPSPPSQYHLGVRTDCLSKLDSRA